MEGTDARSRTAGPPLRSLIWGLWLACPPPLRHQGSPGTPQPVCKGEASLPLLGPVLSPFLPFLRVPHFLGDLLKENT